MSSEGEREPRAVKAWPAAQRLLLAWPEQWDEVDLEPAFFYDEARGEGEYVGMAYHFVKSGKLVSIATTHPQSVLDHAHVLKGYVASVTSAFQKAGVTT